MSTVVAVTVTVTGPPGLAGVAVEGVASDGSSRLYLYDVTLASPPALSVTWIGWFTRPAGPPGRVIAGGSGRASAWSSLAWSTRFQTRASLIAPGKKWLSWLFHLPRPITIGPPLSNVPAIVVLPSTTPLTYRVIVWVAESYVPATNVQRSVSVALSTSDWVTSKRQRALTPPQE